MTKLKESKSRNTGAVIALHENEHWYELECVTHGMMSDIYYRITYAKRDMSKSDEWCIGCIEGWE